MSADSPRPSPSDVSGSIQEFDVGAVSTLDWFQVDPRACFIVLSDLTIMRCNSAAADMLRRGALCVREDALSFGRAASDRTLAIAVQSVVSNKTPHKQIVLLSQDFVWCSVALHAAPGEPVAFLSIHGSKSSGLPLEALEESFGLTAAQARVVGGLVAGLAPKEIGRHMDVSTDTVRTHLRAIYRKLNARGLAGTIRLVSQWHEASVEPLSPCAEREGREGPDGPSL